MAAAFAMSSDLGDYLGRKIRQQSSFSIARRAMLLSWFLQGAVA